MTKNKEFYTEFFNFIYPYIKDKSFYVINGLTGKATPFTPNGIVNHDNVSSLFYVGDKHEDSKVWIYWYNRNHLDRTSYEQSSVGRIFYDGKWNLKEWYNNGLDAKDFTGDLPSSEDLFNQIYESFDNDFEWAEDVVNNASNIKLGPKVVVINRGKYFPTNTRLMAELGIPGVEEFLTSYGQYWWEQIGYYDEEFTSKIPALGIPENGDICYIINGPVKQGTHRESDNIYALMRESDGKQFIIGEKGFEYL